MWLLSSRSSILYRRIKPKAVADIMDLVAKCPELKAKTRLPRSTFDPAYIMSLGPRYTSGFSVCVCVCMLQTPDLYILISNAPTP
jgi:hypothetical protein